MNKKHLIQTVGEKCRVCYTCVRECPAKAIRISGGQAEIIPDRCIACGHCVLVCSQNAKQVRSSIDEVKGLLDSDDTVVALVAPSFAAEFPTLDHEKFVGILKDMGFTKVIQVAFGADLVARAQRELIEQNPDHRYIATPCPAIVSYVEKYHPSLVKYLSPLVSPMVAAAKVARQEYGVEAKTVFIGPCIAKKYEADRSEHEREVDAVVTFYELHKILDDKDFSSIEASPFDGPTPHKGTVFPIMRGIIQASGIDDDLMKGDVVSTEGMTQFIEIMKDFEKGNFDDLNFLDPLCCTGCHMGPGMTSNCSQPFRQALISRFARKSHRAFIAEKWQKNMEKYEYLDLSSNFTINDMRIPIPSKEELRAIFERMGKTKKEDQLNCGACGYKTCIEHAVAIHKGMAESEMCLPYTIDELKKTAQELIKSYDELSTTKQSLIQHEKLASMGQLSAGIAHEVNNPLGVILLYSHLLLDEVSENEQMTNDLKTIVEQAERCKTIVGGLLNFARKNEVVLMRTEVNSLLRKTLKALIKPGNIKISVEPSCDKIYAELDRDQFSQVIVNLVGNAIEAMTEGGRIRLVTDLEMDEVVIRVIDTGPGISEENIKKVFEPFFTTKQIGKGTGLGLAVSYGIVKMHHGKISVTSNTDPAKGDTGTSFCVRLPKIGKEKNIIG